MAINELVKAFIDNTVKRDRATHSAQINADVLDWLEAQDKKELLLMRYALGGNQDGRTFSVNGGRTWHKSIRDAVYYEIQSEQFGI